MIDLKSWLARADTLNNKMAWSWFPACWTIFAFVIAQAVNGKYIQYNLEDFSKMNQLTVNSSAAIN